VEPDLAAMVFDSLGITIADLERAGAEAYDLERLKELTVDRAPAFTPQWREFSRIHLIRQKS
jgi:hypothetical protein